MTAAARKPVPGRLDDVVTAGRLAVLTGAGISTASGIPDYRDADGNWKHAAPIEFPEFRRSAAARRRYWARSFAGWPHFSTALPNAAHESLAGLEARGLVDAVVTQNVDGLHREAGSRRLIDLHGCLDTIVCLDCGGRFARRAFQQRLEAANPDWHVAMAPARPDGDAELDRRAERAFAVPACTDCGGVLKPDVVMFGENVPAARVASAFDAVDRAAALLVIGSSLMVFSGYRFARRAHERGIPLVVVNRGRTRADDIATLKIDRDCVAVLEELAA